MENRYQYPGQELELFEAARNWKSYLADKIKPYEKGKVLEVGAGISETTTYVMNEKVTHWTCLEPDEKLFAITQKKINEKMLPGQCIARQGTLTTLSPDEKFDTILYIDVLEHIQDDVQELKKANAHLLPGGNLIILSPAFQSLYNAFDKAVGHYRRYTKSTLSQIIPPDLLLQKLFYLESLGMSLLLVNRFWGKPYPSPVTIRFWDRFLIPLSKVADTILFHCIGKSIIGIWKKK